MTLSPRDASWGEAAWVEQARGGSAAAFGRLVDQHQQAVRAFLRRLCGDWALADDLAQETFVTAWERIGRFERERSVKLWLFGIAWRKYLTARRGDARRARREAFSAPLEDCAPSLAPGSDARLDTARALAALPPEQAAAVALCLGADFSHSDAAEALGLPLGTVKSHVVRGRAKLLELMGAGDE
jgi:RNA polymerase sigma-70 factor (ECF subfamily)